MKTQNTLFETNNGKRSFSGVINPTYKPNQITLFDEWNVNEMELKEAPTGINLNLFKAVSALVGIETPKTIKRLK